VCGSAIVVEASTEVSEERGEFLGARDAEMDEGSAFLFSCAVIAFEGEHRRPNASMPFRKNLSRVVKIKTRNIAGFIALNSRNAEEFSAPGRQMRRASVRDDRQRQLAQPLDPARRAQHAAPLQRAAPGA